MVFAFGMPWSGHECKIQGLTPFKYECKIQGLTPFKYRQKVNNLLASRGRFPNR